MLKTIALYTLDAYNTEGESGKSGTSAMAKQFLANWFEQYGKCKKFPISATFLKEEQVRIHPHSAIVSCLQQGGVAVIRCYLGGDGHYVLLTRALGDEIGLFDPYAVHPAYGGENRGILHLRMDFSTRRLHSGITFTPKKNVKLLLSPCLHQYQANLRKRESLQNIE